MGPGVATTTNVKGWNGRMDGSEAADGVYYYFMDLAYEARGCGSVN